jgi:arylsulfatase A
MFLLVILLILFLMMKSCVLKKYRLPYVIGILMFFSACKKETSFQPVNSTSSMVNHVSNLARPNIIFMLADDIGFEIPTFSGGQSYSTPNIDRMAQEGMAFTQCYTAPLCSPSRFQVLTAKYNFRNYWMFGHMDPNEKTIADLLRSNGYNTYVAGKWQLDGGDSSVHSLGFNGYCLWNAFIQDTVRRYKSPILYENGAYIDQAYTKNKYADDIFTQRIFRFIDSNRNNNFFVYYPFSLCHPPFQPTPDDSDYASFNPSKGRSNPKYFPSMVKYMDKKLGQVIDTLKAWGLYQNTIVIFAGDNGTPGDIVSQYKGTSVKGGKGQTTIYGSNVPMLITWPGHVAANSIDSNLVDFVDFMATLADATSTSIPLNYGTTDGVSFYNQMLGTSFTPRQSVFLHYQPHPDHELNPTKRYAQTREYKLYDSTNYFYNIINDPLEKSPLKTRNLTQQEKQIKYYLHTINLSEHN